MEHPPFERQHFRARRRLLLMLATPAVVVAVLFFYAVFGNDRVYEPGPVSTAHALFADECWRCHTAGEQTTPWQRTFNDRVSAVPDAACTVCHAGPPHHEPLSQPQTLACAGCHREHRGHAQLAAVDNSRCAVCHADLNATERPAESFARSITSFANHPEFAILDPQRKVSDTAARHQVVDVAEFVDDRWQDKAQIRLNHAVHLNPQGILRLDGRRRTLDCQSCHEPDATGYMRPINYERHCAECHQDKLNFDSELFPEAPVPHGNAVAAVGVMRQRYSQYFQDHPELHDIVPGAAEPAAKVELATALDRSIPGKPPRLPERGWDWVNERVERAERIVWQQPQDGCRYCHTRVEQIDNSWRVAAPQIPDRWFAHAKFRHDRHRLLACTHCHTSVETSRATSDVLLPSIETCRACHTNNTPQPLAGTARSHCAECHEYHQHAGENFDGSVAVDQ